jgi:flagellar FliL protein
MSAPAAAPAPVEGAPAPKGKKKLIIIIVAGVLVLVLGGGAAAFFVMKSSADAAAAAEEGEDGEYAEPVKKAKKAESKKNEDAGPPVFVPLDPFVVNLADKDVERYAQVGINLQVDDPKIAEQMKAYMPAIRNSVLLILSHKSADDILSTEGKQKLAQEIRRDAARAMGYEIEDSEPEASEEEEEAPKKKRKKKKVESYNPILHVHYSNFIVQ